MNIPWELLWPILIEWLQSCMKKQSATDDEIKSRLKNPSGMDWFALWLKLRRAGQTIREASATCEALRVTTWGDEQYQDLIDQAKAA